MSQVYIGQISPFDSGARRHTSFASVWVYPAVEDDINIKQMKRLRQTLTDHGAGGQHVNTTDSAVRITHYPRKLLFNAKKKGHNIKIKKLVTKCLKQDFMSMKSS